MRSWVARVLARIRRLAQAEHVKLTRKARDEIGDFPIEVDWEDLLDLLESLQAGDLYRRQWSGRHEWMYVFKLQFGGQTVYMKLTLRDHCQVISFHEDEIEDEQQDEGK
jgi:hypothetical protein